ncbi:MAG: sugar ABC transporter substrate-binding protein [Deinococcota bacterium]
MNRMKHVLPLVALVSLLAFAQAQVTLRYSLWDGNQLPSYQQCAVDFTAQTGINVEIEQLGWEDYWSNIQTGFVSGEAPDVFTNHLAKYPEFVALGQLTDIQPLVEADALDTSIYIEGLADLWIRDGERYGLPKDFDTIAIVFNKAALEAAGVTLEEINDMTWNSDDGGSFEEVIARLTIDANGNNGLSPDFDKESIVQYGFTNEFGSAGAYGQTEWSWLAVANGFSFNNGIWGDEYFYDDPQLAEVFDWFTSLWLEKGYSPDMAEQTSLGRAGLFQSGTVAMVPDGSWMIGTYLGSNFEVGFAHLPAVDGARKSMFNGLADSIWVGTEHPDEAWEWVKYLASPECINVVGASGVVFPSTEEGLSLSVNVRDEAGIDITAFTEQATMEGGTFLFPITDFGSEINTIMAEATQAIGLGQGSATELLEEANEEINDLF